jgi:hypothetical protein
VDFVDWTRPAFSPENVQQSQVEAPVLQAACPVTALFGPPFPGTPSSGPGPPGEHDWMVQLALPPANAAHALRACGASYVPLGTQSSNVWPTPFECTAQADPEQPQPPASSPCADPTDSTEGALGTTLGGEFAAASLTAMAAKSFWRVAGAFAEGTLASSAPPSSVTLAAAVAAEPPSPAGALWLPGSPDRACERSCSPSASPHDVHANAHAQRRT